VLLFLGLMRVMGVSLGSGNADAMKSGARRAAANLARSAAASQAKNEAVCRPTTRAAHRKPQTSSRPRRRLRDPRYYSARTGTRGATAHISS
jgi:hypothetical protein